MTQITRASGQELRISWENRWSDALNNYIWSFCRVKQGRVPAGQADNPLIGDQYLFVALDQWTKLVPSFTVGKRTKENAEHFMLDLADRLVTPELAHRADP